jgi:hypothetical protein
VRRLRRRVTSCAASGDAQFSRPFGQGPDTFGDDECQARENRPGHVSACPAVASRRWRRLDTHGTGGSRGAGVNDPWSWHLDPASVEFADATIATCDWPPSFVESEEITSPYYCPWSAELTALDQVSS